MHRARLVAFAALLGAGGAALALRTPSGTPHPLVRAVSGGGQSSIGATVYLDSALAQRQRILRQIAGSDTYLQHMLTQGDSMLRRWPDRVNKPITVHLDMGAKVSGVSEAHRQAVRDAFARWQRVAAIPVQFAFVRDSARAEVRVRWVRTFAMRRAGQADVVWNQDGWLVKASLTLATNTTDGQVLSPDAVYTVTLHEIGHLLGLGHSDAPEDVMYPTTSVHDLTFRDRHTARLLYALPPGSLRFPETLD